MFTGRQLSLVKLRPVDLQLNWGFISVLIYQGRPDWALVLFYNPVNPVNFLHCWWPSSPSGAWCFSEGVICGISWGRRTFSVWLFKTSSSTTTCLNTWDYSWFGFLVRSPQHKANWMYMYSLCSEVNQDEDEQSECCVYLLRGVAARYQYQPSLPRWQALYHLSAGINGCWWCFIVYLKRVQNQWEWSLCSLLKVAIRQSFLTALQF